jgi:hypothetical protein
MRPSPWIQILHVFNELVTLGSLRKILVGMRDAYGTCSPQDAAGDESPRAAMARRLVASEVGISSVMTTLDSCMLCRYAVLARMKGIACNSWTRYKLCCTLALAGDPAGQHRPRGGTAFGHVARRDGGGGPRDAHMRMRQVCRTAFGVPALPLEA